MSDDKLTYEELFVATLQMFSLKEEADMLTLEPNHIVSVFKKVLEANELCQEAYDQTLAEKRKDGEMPFTGI